MLKQLFTKSGANSETPNIFKKMFFGFVIVPVIPIFALIYLTGQAQIEEEKAAESTLINSTKLIAVNIDRWIEKNVRVSSFVSQMEGVRSMDPELQKPLLINIKKTSNAITAVRIDSDVGQAISRSDNKALKNYSDRQYFQQVKNGGAIGQQVILGKTQKKPLLCFTVPINNEGAFVGALSQCSTLEDISTRVTDLRIGDTGFAFLVDRSNKLIAYGGDDNELVGNLEDMSTHSAISSGDYDSVFSINENNKELIAYKEKVGLDWTLVVVQEYREAFASPIQAKNSAILATVITFITCVLIVFLMSRLIAKPLQESREETDNILGAATDGLFLIDREYIIGRQQSANLNTILQKGQLSGKSFMSYLNEAVTMNVAQMAQDYIDLLFTDRIKEELIKSRNPLKLVQTSIENEHGQLESKYLSLTFKRVARGASINNLLVTAKDITKEILLQKELEKAKEEKDEQINLLTDILYIPHARLFSFLEETDKTLNQINVILEKPGSGSSFFKQKVDSIYRLVHKIKGDASAISFELFASECHEFEELLSDIKIKPGLTGNEFLPVTLALEGLYQKSAMIDELFRKINSFVKNGDDTMADETVPEHLQEWSQLKTLADNLAGKHDKSVEVHFRGFKTKLPDNYQSAVRDIATQLIRNSVVHGIETISDREKSAKLQEGQITMSMKYTYGTGYIFTYMDDGQGIDYEKIRYKLVKDGVASSKEVELYSEKELLKAIFKSGFSVKEKADFDAGRGVGLSLVASKIKELDGRIQVSSVFGKRTMFKVVLPCTSSVAA